MALKPSWINKNLIGIITGYNQPETPGAMARPIETLSKVPSLAVPELRPKKLGCFGARRAILAVKFHFSGIKECREQADIPSKIICGISPTGAIKGNWKLCPEGPYDKILFKRPINEKAYGKHYFKN
jgi:hypothetical protein